MVVPWRTCQKADVQRDGETRLPTGCWVWETTAVGTFDVCSNAAVNSDLSCFLYTLQRQTKAAVFALPGRLSGVTMVISSWRHKHLFPLPPTALIRHCPLFRCDGVRASGVPSHGRREATSDRLIASAERPVTIIPLTIGLSVTGNR